MLLCRENFLTSCLEFQRDIDDKDNSKMRTLLSEKDFLQSEIHNLDKKNRVLKNSVLAFEEEILEDLHRSNSGYIFSSYCIYEFSTPLLTFNFCRKLGQALPLSLYLCVLVGSGYFS